MLSDKEEQERQVLSILSEAVSPVGSGQLSREFKQKGRDVSEATIGRLLRHLDLMGYTERLGYQGRILTPVGRARLKDLEQRKSQLHDGYRFLDSLRAEKLDELLDVLVARRGIERETARLAAENITAAELERLRDLVGKHKSLSESGEIGAAEDVEFHRTIAKASRNRVLLAASDVIRHNGQLSPVLHYIRTQVKSAIASDHEKIVEALETRDPDAAERAMVQHMENVMNDVRKYWARVRSRPS